MLHAITLGDLLAMANAAEMAIKVVEEWHVQGSILGKALSAQPRGEPGGAGEYSAASRAHESVNRHTPSNRALSPLSVSRGFVRVVRGGSSSHCFVEALRARVGRAEGKSGPALEHGRRRDGGRTGCSKRRGPSAIARAREDHWRVRGDNCQVAPSACY